MSRDKQQPRQAARTQRGWRSPDPGRSRLSHGRRAAAELFQPWSTKLAIPIASLKRRQPLPQQVEEAIGVEFLEHGRIRCPSGDAEEIADRLAIAVAPLQFHGDVCRASSEQLWPQQPGSHARIVQRPARLEESGPTKALILADVHYPSLRKTTLGRGVGRTARGGNGLHRTDHARAAAVPETRLVSVSMDPLSSAWRARRQRPAARPKSARSRQE